MKVIGHYFRHVQTILPDPSDVLLVRYRQNTEQLQFRKNNLIIFYFSETAVHYSSFTDLMCTSYTKPLRTATNIHKHNYTELSLTKILP